MLEKQKAWCHDKMEKGKKWINDHKLTIGYVAGVTTLAVSQIVVSKIFEPKRRVGQVYRGDFDKEGVIDFAIGITEVDRFGIEHVDKNKVLLCEEESKELLFNNIEAAISETKAAREKAK